MFWKAFQIHELDELRRRLREAEETLNAIRDGEVDALVASGPSGEKVFTLEGAEHPYRVLVESMNEGGNLALRRRGHPVLQFRICTHGRCSTRSDHRPRAK